MSSRPIISILHPTARVRPYPPSFPRGWKGACEQFGNAAFHPENIEYVLIIHESNWAEFWTEYGGPPPDGNAMYAVPHVGDVFGTFYVVQNHGRNCVVDQINTGAAAASGSLFVGIMDDLEAPLGWDEKLLELLRREGRSDPDQRLGRGLGDWVIDLTAEPTPHIVYSALTRAHYEKYGYVLHPDFESMYSDNYYSDRARLDGVVIDGRGLGFHHRHYTSGETVMDDVYRQHNSPAAYFNGRNTYARLMGQPKQEAIALCLPGEWYQSEWVSMWTNLFGYLAQALGFLVNPFFAHSSNVYCTRMDLAKGVLESEIEVDWVLWIDDDNKLSCDQFDQLLRDLREHPELDGVCGWCWCDNHQDQSNEWKNWTMSCGKQGPNMECLRFTPDDIKTLGPIVSARDIERDDSNMGFWSGFPVILMRRAALAQLGPGAFAPVFREDINFGFSGEDTAFFWRAREAGMNFAVDFRVKVPHVKWRAIEPVFTGASEAAAPELVNAM